MLSLKKQTNKKNLGNFKKGLPDTTAHPHTAESIKSCVDKGMQE